MPNESTSRWARPTRNARDAYPKDLAALVAARWEYRSGASDPPDRDPIHPLPEASVLEGALSACYQASLLREDESPVIFRLALREPEAFPNEGGPPDGMQRLEFPKPRRFDAQELRRQRRGGFAALIFRTTIFSHRAKEGKRRLLFPLFDNS